MDDAISKVKRHFQILRLPWRQQKTTRLLTQVTGKIAPTKAWDDFVTVSVGDILLDQTGSVTLVIRPTSMPAGAVMNLKAIKLSPQ